MPPTETCDQCGFDATEWNQQDTYRTIGLANALFDQWTGGMSDQQANTRPSDDVWSPFEYADHTRETMFGMRLLIEVARESSGTDLGPIPSESAPGESRTFDRDSVLAALDEEATALSTLVATLDESDDLFVVLDGERHDPAWAARHAVHELWHHLIDVADGRVAGGDPTSPSEGSVAQINVSGGGVPKLPVDSAVVGRRGVEGDSQTARVHHGRPFQALCLWSADVIAELIELAHPVAAGSAGENFTLAELDWKSLRAGTVLEIGDVTCQLSAAAVPCQKNAQWFSDGDFNRIHHDNNPQWTRWYASVLTAGNVNPGDRVRVVR
jgi:MOSC domain-containing protein YiiM